MNTIDFKHFIEKLIASNRDNKPTTATIIRINGNLADIQIGTSPVYLRNIEIYGDPDGFAIGDEVALIWTEKPGSYGPVPIIQSAPNISISTAGSQLLAITEPDPFSRAGWRVTSDGMIYLDDTRIHPDGQISMGSGENIAVMSSANASYRFWAGAIQPGSAPFSVDKEGKIKATAGQIANWNIEENQLYADSYDAILNASTYPYVGLGGATGYGEEGIWLGKDDDNVYKMYVGDPVGQHMYWDGSELYITGSFAGSTTLAGTKSTSWTINEDDDNTDVALEFKHPTADGTIIYDGSKFVFNKSLEMGGDVTFQDILPALADTYDVGSSTHRWKTAYISEIESTLFVEDTVSAIGGWFLIPHSQGSLNEDVDNSETQIDFGANSIEVDDFILLRGNSEVEYMQATSLVSGNNWNVTRNLDGSGANAWPIGHVYIVLGNTGDGRIELNAQTDGPQIGILEQGSAYNQQTERLRLGNLNNWQGAGLSGYGWAAGDFSGNEYAYYSPTTGMVIRGTIKADDGYLANLGVSGTLDIGAGGVLKSVSSEILSIDSGYYFEYNSGNPRFRIGQVIDPDILENGEFDDSSNWIFNDGWSWDGALYRASCDGTQTDYSSLYYDDIDLLAINNTYQVSFTITFVSGSIRAMCGDALGNPISTDGSYSEAITAIGDQRLHFRADANFVGTVDNVAVVPYTNVVDNGTFDTDTDWTKGTGWTISGGKASCDGTQVSTSFISQVAIEHYPIDYKVIYTLSDYSAGSLTLKVGATTGATRTANGTYTELLINSGLVQDTIKFIADADFVGKIDNVYCQKVYEHPDDPYPHINKGIHWDGNNLIIKSSNTSIDAEGNLIATNVELTGSITALTGKLQNLLVEGDLNVVAGFIRGGAYDYNDGTGFWLGCHEDEYKFFIGNASGNKLTYDGTTLTLVGDGDGITNIDGGHIQTGSVTTTQIHTNTILAADISAGAITANEIAGNTITGDKINLNSYLAIKSATYGQDGIQLQYNGGNPRAYIGNGSSNYFQFDGTNVSMSGSITATGGTITGTLNITGGGKITVGSDVELSTSGLVFKSGTGTGQAIYWLDGSYYTGFINSSDSGTWNKMGVTAGNFSETKPAELRLTAEEAGNGYSTILLRASNNSDDSSIDLSAGYGGTGSYINLKRSGITSTDADGMWTHTGEIKATYLTATTLLKAEGTFQTSGDVIFSKDVDIYDDLDVHDYARVGDDLTVDGDVIIGGILRKVLYVGIKGEIYTGSKAVGNYSFDVNSYGIPTDATSVQVCVEANFTSISAGAVIIRGYNTSYMYGVAMADNTSQWGYATCWAPVDANGYLHYTVTGSTIPDIHIKMIGYMKEEET